MAILQQDLGEFKVKIMMQQAFIGDMVSNRLPKETRQLIQSGGADLS